MSYDRRHLLPSRFQMHIYMSSLELVSKELNHLAAILQHYAGGLIFMKLKTAQIYYYDPQSAGINMQSPQSESTSRRLTLVLSHDTPTNSCIFYLELKDMHSSFHHSSRMKYVFASDTLYMFVSAMLSKF